MRFPLSYSMSDTTATATALTSLGQGNPSSLPCRTLSAQRFSIVDRLASRSLTGRPLQILVHQHFGYRLHLEWSANNNANSDRFLERRFCRWDQAKLFSNQLYTLEGVCTCAYDASYMPYHDKTPRCRRGPFYASQKHLLLPKWELKAMEDTTYTNLSECNITSTPPDLIHW